MTNEKYKGSALLQKKFTVDFLTKKQKVNEGEVPQYLVEHSHPPIIDPEEFELVQAEIERRQGIGRVYSSSNIFSARIVCACCGSFFGSKVGHSTSKYRRVIWQCNHKFSNGEKCTTPHLYEDEIRKGFIEVCKQVFTDKAEFIASCREIVALLSDCTALDKKIEEAYTRLDDLATAMQEFIKENAMHPQDEDFYSNRLAEYDVQKSEAEARLNELQIQKAAIAVKDLFIRTRKIIISHCFTEGLQPFFCFLAALVTGQTTNVSETMGFDEVFCDCPDAALLIGIQHLKQVTFMLQHNCRTATVHDILHQFSDNKFFMVSSCGKDNTIRSEMIQNPIDIILSHDGIADM